MFLTIVCYLLISCATYVINQTAHCFLACRNSASSCAQTEHLLSLGRCLALFSIPTAFAFVSYCHVFLNIVSIAISSGVWVELETNQNLESLTLIISV